MQQTQYDSAILGCQEALTTKLLIFNNHFPHQCESGAYLHSYLSPSDNSFYHVISESQYFVQKFVHLLTSRITSLIKTAFGCASSSSSDVTCLGSLGCCAMISLASATDLANWSAQML